METVLDRFPERATLTVEEKTVREYRRVLDEALDAAEKQLERMLETGFAPERIAELFAAHIDNHLAPDMAGAKRYGNSVSSFHRAIVAGKV